MTILEASALPGVDLLTPRERDVYTRWAVGHLDNGSRRGTNNGRRQAIAKELGLSLVSVSVVWRLACARIRAGGPAACGKGALTKEQFAERDIRIELPRFHCPRCKLRGCDGVPAPVGVCLPASATYYGSLRLEVAT